jgi:ribosomal protein L7Ae-like RNA K-turn-binding protein
VNPDCLKRAAKSGFRRSFRAQVDTPEPEEFVETVRAAIRRRLDETARLAVRSQAAGVGARAVDEAMKSNTVKVVFIASDAGQSTRKKYASNAERKNVSVVAAFDGATLGTWSGRDFVAVMTVGGRLAERLLRDVENIARLGRVMVEASGEA